MEEDKKDIKKIKANPELRAIKTYRDFAVSSLRGGSTSLAKMIIKEKKKRDIQTEQSSEQKKNNWMIFVSVFFILLGIVIVSGVFFYSTQQTTSNKDKIDFEVKSTVPYDYKKAVDLDGLDHRKIGYIFKELIEESNIPIGDVKILYFLKKNKEDYNEIATIRDFLEVLDTRIPIKLERTLYKNFTTGIVTIDKNLPFLLFKINSYDVAYVKMREWEKSVLFDMGGVLNVNKRFFTQQFVDLNLYNEDIRVVLDEEGEIIFGYSFLDMNTLLFFTSAKTFKHFKAELQAHQKLK